MSGQILDKYPWSKILPRWFLGAAEIGISIYLVAGFHMYIGLAYAAYWILALFVLLPLIRCTKCYYYGKRCNTAWGLWAGFAFPKGDPIYFTAGYALTFLIWPLRIAPIGLGLLGLIDGVKFIPDGLFGIYILVIIVHRLYYRGVNCRVCRQQHVCPVYNPHVLVTDAPVPETTTD
jgi:hypothetical protein